MFCDCGSNDSAVINTRHVENGIKRQRRCQACSKSFHTLETLFVKPVFKESKLEDMQPDERGLYTEEAASAVKMQKVETRRKNEDRVADYFIEDDFDN